MTTLDEHVVALADSLRARGVEVSVDATLTFAAALPEVTPDGRRGIYWAARATLIRRPDDVTAFDEAFEAWWNGSASTSSGDPAEPVLRQPVVVEDPAADASEDGAALGDIPALVVRASAREQLRRRDFAAATPDELDQIHRLMADLALVATPHRRRRHRRSRRGERLDLRTTARDAARHDGEVLRWARLAPAERPRRVVMLVDVSGSMAPYADALLRLGHAAVAGRGRHRVPVEVFTLGTRLTRVTRELSDRDPDVALAAAAAAVEDWSGGTRLGATIGEFTRRFGAPGLARGADVIVLSDGWDRGDPRVMDEEMSRLARLARRIVWVNPLVVQPGYAPVAAGMAAALPHVDHLVAGHDLRSLESLVSLLALA